MPSRRLSAHCIAAGFTLWLVVLAGHSSVRGQTSDRLVPEKPATGPSVETPQGFMVAWTATIPGTNITFEMTPVPGDAEQGIEPFWIGKHEVKAEEYVEYMKLYSVFRELERQKLRRVSDMHQIDAITAPTPVYEPMFHFEFTTDPKQPAVSMSQFAARQYTKWLSLISSQQYRLPTEQEWEYACRAGTTTTWSFGNDPTVAKDYCVFIENSSEDGPHLVGSLKPNAWGIHDMHGNVSEWVLTKENLRDHRRFRDNRSSWNQAAYDDQFRTMILRGGNSQQSIDACQSSARRAASRDFWDYDPNLPFSPCWLACEDCRFIGFRIVSPLEPHSRDDIERYWGPDTQPLVWDVADHVSAGSGVLGIADEKLPELVQQLFDKSHLRRERPPWDYQKKQPTGTSN